MSRGTRFLEIVTDKLKERILEMDGTIQEIQRDIAGMHEYYWENYAEMDQYGYEEFDNQQALLSQVQAQEEKRKQRQSFQKMLDSPFFGSVEFLYTGDTEPENFYIGIGNFSEKRGGVPLIYDWRAPVCSLFYDFDKGEASYEAPAGIMKGEILSKWQYKIRNGRMIYEFESEMKIDDDILKQELGANGDVQLKNIVRTIQREQNAIIRNRKDRILVIQGVAGSGKTSVALHRIAYLLYHDKKHLHASNVLVLSPNSVFSDYISHILPELGEENIREMSFDLFAYRELKTIVEDCEDRYHQIERQIQHGKKFVEAEERYRWKQSREFVQSVEKFLIELEDRLVDFHDIEYRGFSKKADEILKLFYYKFSEVPLLSRMDALMECFVDEYETLYGRNLSEEECDVIQGQFQSLYVSTDLYEIYNWFLEEYGYPLLPDLPKEKRYLSYEDVSPLLYLKHRLRTATVHRKIRHLVIDEMQDYSYLQYVILGQMFACNMTILGDRAQTVDTIQRDVLSFLPKLFGKEVRCMEMKRTYRSTAEISEYAGKIGGIKGIEVLQRHGKEVIESCHLNWENIQQEILDNVKVSGQGREIDAYETAAVLTMTEQEAEEIYQTLKRYRRDVFYMDRNSSAFQKGVTVTTFYYAKGLEFDQVFVVGGDPENLFFDRFRYICATRALHELYVYQKRR